MPADPIPIMGSTAGRRFGLGGLIFGLLLLAVVIGIGLHLGEVAQFVALGRQSDPVWLLAAFLLQSGTYLCAAAVWGSALRRAGWPLPLPVLVRLSLAKLFADHAIPSAGVSGGLLFTQGLHRYQVPAAVGWAALLFSLLTSFLAALPLTLWVLWALHRVDHTHPLLVALLLGYLILALVMVLGVLLLRETTHWPRLERLPWGRSLLVMLREAAPGLLRSPALVARGTLLQAALVVLDGLTLWTLLHAVGMATAPTAAVAALVAANAAAALSPIPAGLGTFEGTAVAVLALLDTPIAAALTATLLLRGFALWLPLLPGLWLARRLLARHDDELSAASRGRPRPGATHE
ncbi:MAG: hypothetical protein AMXMBFR26_23080 [Porticoccaceae bacterium]